MTCASLSRTGSTQTFTTMFNSANTAVYINSYNNFAEHMGWIEVAMSAGNRFVRDGFYISLMAFIPLIIANQVTYTTTISRILKPFYARCCADIPQNEDNEPLRAQSNRTKGWELTNSFTSRAHVFIASAPFNAFAAGTKALISSASFMALINAWGCPPTIAWLVSSVMLFGNWATQFAIFSIPFQYKFEHFLPTCFMQVLSYHPPSTCHALTFMYNVMNVALYFNTPDAFLRNIQYPGVLLRISEGGHPLLLAFLIMGSTALLISTQHEYSKKMLPLFDINAVDPEIDTENPYYSMEPATENTQSICCHTSLWFIALCSSVYKTCVTSMSLIEIGYKMTNRLQVGVGVAALCITGNLVAQFSVLAPKKEAHTGTSAALFNKTEFCSSQVSDSSSAELF